MSDLFSEEIIASQPEVVESQSEIVASQPEIIWPEVLETPNETIYIDEFDGDFGTWQDEVQTDDVGDLYSDLG